MYIEENINFFQNFFESKIISFDILKGGITNKMYKIKTCDDIYILRFYGKNTELFIDRDLEIKMLNYLSNEENAPKIIKIFNGGRIEEFKKGVISFEPAKYQELLCKSLVKLHNIRMKNFMPFFWSKFNKLRMENNIYIKEINEVIKKIYNYSNYWNELIIGHGDLTLGNVLLNNENNKVNLIDFEYSCVMPRGFELGNHLCEYYGFTIDKLLYPEKKIRMNLIKYYLKHYYKINNEDNHHKHNNSIVFNNKDIEIIDLYSLISHYYWGCWAYVQSKVSTINFNYKSYGDNRFSMFLYYKKIFDNKNYEI